MPRTEINGWSTVDGMDLVRTVDDESPVKPVAEPTDPIAIAKEAVRNLSKVNELAAVYQFDYIERRNVKDKVCSVAIEFFAQAIRAI
jgi:hypothetical protein